MWRSVQRQHHAAQPSSHGSVAATVKRTQLLTALREWNTFRRAWRGCATVACWVSMRPSCLRGVAAATDMANTSEPSGARTDSFRLLVSVMDTSTSPSSAWLLRRLRLGRACGVPPRVGHS